jgi:ABC-type branched-subunit amino acid transport system substrate-binding protein
MDDATLVKVVAARYLRDMGSEALRYLREMQELAAGLSDADSAEAWRDIADAARVILFTPTSDSARPRTQPALGAFRGFAD